jgi:hypothetical protein
MGTAVSVSVNVNGLNSKGARLTCNIQETDKAGILNYRNCGV